MIKVRAHASPTELQVAGGLKSSISGSLYLEVGDDFFPSESWGDYVVPVLGWWLENAQRLSYAGIDVENGFMDGDYKFSMRRIEGTDTVFLTLRDGRVVAGVRELSFRRYLATLRGAAKCVLNELRGLGASCEGEASNLLTRLEHVERLEAVLKAGPLP